MGTPSQTRKTTQAIARRFGYEWDRYAELLPQYEEQFRRWTAPLPPEFWQGKRVLDAGCGMGRNAYWCLTYGAREVVAFDYDQRSVDVADILLMKFPNASVSLRSIYDIPYEAEFDCVLSIGVVHHLEDPARAMARLAAALRPGGTLIVWLYAQEGNEGLLRWLRPARWLTSRLPMGLVHALTYAISIPFVGYLRLAPQRSPYRQRLARYSFRHVHSIVFDQLFPRVSRYYRREELEALCRPLGLSSVQLLHTEGYSWTILGVK